ncbi:unnamed protein product [Brassicogethes aeneus]|uniref:Uncharacterized protein n=1 Tax=Brassicogethes aeneus TaxID=1431903 RepID=A0A9P0AQF9_BRAAE|nr:unnamed protein product [Brassicogethes aeneus]
MTSWASDQPSIAVSEQKNSSSNDSSSDESKSETNLSSSTSDELDDNLFNNNNGASDNESAISDNSNPFNDYPLNEIDDSDNDHTIGEDNDDPLNEIMFDSANLSKKDVLTMVYGLSLRHKLTNEARSDILELIRMCANLDTHSFSTTSYSFSKIFNPPDNEIKYQFYCNQCYHGLTDSMTKKLRKKVVKMV